MEALTFAKATTVVPKETSTMCALYDTMDHCIDMCLIMAGVKEAHRQVNKLNQFPRSGNNLYSNTYTPSWRNHPNFGWQHEGQQNTQ